MVVEEYNSVYHMVSVVSVIEKKISMPLCSAQGKASPASITT